MLLARALVAQPDLLLLDEPTNHLDTHTISWLETLVTDHAGAVVVVTHDRAFLRRVATRIVELDRGRLTSWPGDYANYLRRQEERLADELVLQVKQDKKLAAEEAWLRKGIKARRTRNEGRVKALMALRAERANRRMAVGGVRMHGRSATLSGRLVVEAEAVSRSFDDTLVIQECTTRILRGDRVGLIGPNGAGKTTLLRLLLGELRPDGGEIRRGANVQVAYYDQQREQLDPERTVFDTLGDGSDNVTVDGESRHVHGYLRDFLFPRDRAQSPVKALSGGERNRLLLARLFTRPANLLVLDEPTNDLDLETLDLLEARLVAWSGTLLLVSHDRTFLDNVVTSTLVFEGDGRVSEYVGGYSDWLRQRPAAPVEAVEDGVRPPRDARGAPKRATAGGSPPVTQRLAYHEQRELVALPQQIEALETATRRLNKYYDSWCYVTRVSHLRRRNRAVSLRGRAPARERAGAPRRRGRVTGPGFYRETPAAIKTTLARLDEVKQELDEAYARWEALEARSRELPWLRARARTTPYFRAPRHARMRTHSGRTLRICDARPVVWRRPRRREVERAGASGPEGGGLRHPARRDVSYGSIAGAARHGPWPRGPAT